MSTDISLYLCVPEAWRMVAGMGHAEADGRLNTDNCKQGRRDGKNNSAINNGVLVCKEYRLCLPLGSVRHSDHNPVGHAPGPEGSQAHASLLPGMRRRVRALCINLRGAPQVARRMYGT